MEKTPRALRSIAIALTGAALIAFTALAVERTTPNTAEADAPTVRWRTDVEKALAEARKTDRPLCVVFT